LVARDYEPQTIQQLGRRWTGNYLLAPGVSGFAIEKNGEIHIPIVNSEHERQGHVGRFLDSLSPRCRIVAVVSPVLTGMLERRGWTLEDEVWVPPIGGKYASKKATGP
jgi:hypothetical protein